MTQTRPFPRSLKRLSKCLAVLGVVAAASAVGTAAASASTGLPGGKLDPVTIAADGSTWTLTGWAIDSKVPTTPILVHTYIDGVVITAATADMPRADLSATSVAGNAHGYSVTVAAPTTAGTHFACEYAINSTGTGPNPLLGCRKIVIPGAVTAPAPVSSTALPGGVLDPLTVAADGSTWTLTGWAIDSKVPTTPILVHTYIDGVVITAATADMPRADLSATSAAGNAHGYSVTVVAPTAAGTHFACEYAINSTGTGPNPLLGCRKIVLPGPVTAPAPAPAPVASSFPLPGGVLDPLTLAVDGSTWTLSGWAIDLKVPTASIVVHTYIDGVIVVAATADMPRADLSTTAAAGNAHGYSVTVAAPTTAGTHFACEYAINTSGTGPNPLLGCRKITL